MSRLTSRALELVKTVKTGEPVLNLNRSVAAESLWPAALEKEAEKASSILRSFFLDGFIVPYRTLGKCPDHVFRSCRAIAVLHVLRAGLHSPSANGSGVMVSRLGDGSWSVAAGIVVDYDLPQGIDVADIVILVNNEEELKAISTPNDETLGKSLTIEPGPIPPSDASASASPKVPRSKGTSFSYAKSKGQLVKLDLAPMIIREANTENERFYGIPGISARDIISGQVKTPSGASNHLYSTLSALDQQVPNLLSGLLKPGKCPGDCRVRPPTTANP